MGAPLTVAKFHFLKRFKVLENDSLFQKYQHFSRQKNPFFLRKFRKIEHILQKFLSFRNIILKISIFLELPCKSREIPDEFFSLVEKFIKKAKQ